MTLKFSELVPIYKAMQPSQGAVVSVVLTQEIKKTLEIILDNDECLAESGITCISDFRSWSIGDNVQLNVASPRIGLGILCSSFEEYISFPSFQLKEKNNFFLRDCVFFSKSAAAPSVVVKYREVLRFLDVLKNCAHYFDERAGSLVYYKDCKFEIPVSYTYDLVKGFDSAALVELELLMSGKLHETQKRRLLAETVMDISVGVLLEERFSNLIKCIRELSSKAQVGYDLFSTDFTYEKAKEEVHSFKLETTARLHKVISDIQTQVLGVPLGTFVALSQIKKANHLGSQFAVNLVILFGCIVFSMLLAGLLFNQYLTLKTIEADVDRQRKVFVERFRAMPEAYEGVFVSLRNRLAFQFFAILGVAALVAVAVVISIVFFVVHTKPIYNILFR